MEAPSASSTGSTEMRTNFRWRLRGVSLYIVLALVFLAAIPLTAYFRTNDANINPKLALESWVALADDRHNGATDLIHFNGNYYLAFVTTTAGLRPTDSRVKVWISSDCRNWQHRFSFYVPNAVIATPRFASIAGRMFLFAHRSAAAGEAPSSTVFTYSDEGVNWEPLRDFGRPGWLLDKAKSPDGRLWYAPAHWHEGGKLILLTTRNGQQWNEVGVIHEGNGVREAGLDFLPDGRMLTAARLDESGGWKSDPEARTLIAVAEAPYQQWSKTSSYLTRLDTPNLFQHGGEIYAIGRHNPDKPSAINRLGGALGRKHTALYRIKPDAMEWLSDLPSAGDTAGAGIAQNAGDLYLTWYTSPTTYDWPWLLGMHRPTEVRVGKMGIGVLPGLP